MTTKRRHRPGRGHHVLVRLEEPNPYQEGCFTGDDNKCAIPTLAAWIGARKDLE